MRTTLFTVFMICALALLVAGCGQPPAQTGKENPKQETEKQPPPKDTSPPAFSTADHKAAAQLMAQATQLYQDKKYDESLAKCNELLAKYSGTPAAAQGATLKVQVDAAKQAVASEKAAADKAAADKAAADKAAADKAAADKAAADKAAADKAAADKAAADKAAADKANPNEPTLKQVEDCYKATKPENIPTFAPIYHDWLFAMYKRDYATAWNLYSDHTRQVMTNFMLRRIGIDKLTLGTYEQALQDPNLQPEQKAGLEAAIADLKKSIAEREECNGDGLKLFTLITENACKRNGTNPISPILRETGHWVKEVIQEDKGIGYALLDVKPNMLGANKQYFVKDKEGWRMDATGEVRIKDENDPPEAPVPPPDVQPPAPPQEG